MHVVYFCPNELIFKIREYKTKGEYHAKGKDFDYFLVYEQGEKNAFNKPTHEAKALVKSRNKELAKVKKILDKSTIVKEKEYQDVIVSFLKRKNIVSTSEFLKEIADNYANGDYLLGLLCETVFEKPIISLFWFEAFNENFKKSVHNKDNFFLNTAAIFENANDFDFQNKKPDHISNKKHEGYTYYCREPDCYCDGDHYTKYDSNVSSVYYYTDKGVYRLSDHWDVVSTCRWVLNNGKVAFEGMINSENENLTFVPCEDSDKWYLGFCAWKDFYSIEQN